MVRGGAQASAERTGDVFRRQPRSNPGFFTTDKVDDQKAKGSRTNIYQCQARPRSQEAKSRRCRSFPNERSFVWNCQQKCCQKSAQRVDTTLELSGASSLSVDSNQPTSLCHTIRLYASDVGAQSNSGLEKQRTYAQHRTIPCFN